jgi:hypothetical protein
MSSLVIQHGLLGLVRLLTTAVVAGWISSPMSWSPDAQWLSYTVAPSSGPDARAPGWIFEESRGRPTAAAADPRREPRADSGRMSYRIWATQPAAESSALLEESAWPLTAPSWSPVGRSLAFGRFVPESREAPEPAPRGRWEILIQDGLDRKRILVTVRDFELDSPARASFPDCSAAWSPDGQFLAFPRPGSPPAILIIKLESRRTIQTLDHARLPAWSPDGSKLAFVRDEDSQNSLQLVERHGASFLAARPAAPLGLVTAAPSWSSDGRSLLAVLERSSAHAQNLELARIAPETGDMMRVLPLVPEALRHRHEIRSVALDVDRDEERCFIAVDIAGRDADVVWGIPRDRTTFKRFHPLDVSLRIGGLAGSPDGRTLALRFGAPDDLTLPALYETATGRTTLLIPDEAGRGHWLAVLARAARTLLLAGLPPAVVAGQAAERPTLLPVPGELPAHHPLSARLARLGRLGAWVCDHPRGRAEEGGEEPGTTATAEDRLFFDYLRGDFRAAAADLQALEPQITAPDQRASLLSLRAQVLWSLGERMRARAVIDYLIATEGAPIRRFEETPAGPVVTADPDPRQTWARYLAARTTEGASPVSPPREEGPERRIDPLLPEPLVPPEFPLIERGDGVRPIPFAPIFPRFDPRPIRGRFADPARRERAGKG